MQGALLIVTKLCCFPIFFDYIWAKLIKEMFFLLLSLFVFFLERRMHYDIISCVYVVSIVTMLCPMLDELDPTSSFVVGVVVYFVLSIYINSKLCLCVHDVCVCALLKCATKSQHRSDSSHYRYCCYGIQIGSIYLTYIANNIAHSTIAYG